MRTKAKTKGKVAIVLSLALVGSMLLPIRIGTKTAQAAEVLTVREVNLSNNGTIPGITNPKQPNAPTDAWSGSYVYLGKYWQDSDTNGDGKVDTSDEKSAIKWRVLSTENDSNGDNNGDSLLLMSDKVLDRVVFSEDGETSWELRWMHKYSCCLYKFLKEIRSGVLPESRFKCNIYQLLAPFCL